MNFSSIASRIAAPLDLKKLREHVKGEDSSKKPTLEPSTKKPSGEKDSKKGVPEDESGRVDLNIFKKPKS